jgi:hypothetical protein
MIFAAIALVEIIVRSKMSVRAMAETVGDEDTRGEGRKCTRSAYGA